MKRILVIANTYYQMIMAIQLSDTIFRDDSVVLLLSDHSLNTKNICNQLKKEQTFEEVHYIQTKGVLGERKALDKIVDYFEISFASKNRYSYYLEGLQNQHFDEIVCYNYGMDIIGLYSILYSYNSNLIVSLFEEGILSYDVAPEKTLRREIINASRRFVGKKNIYDVLGNFYCFHPSLYHGELKAVKVPEVTNASTCALTLRNIFKLDSTKLLYSQKYIFFTSVYDFEGGESIGEYQLVEKIAELVGKDNILVKTHPRDTRSVYSANGFKVDRNSDIPWEAIQLSGDFSDKVFLTATSGSVLAGSFMAEKAVKTYFLCDLCHLDNNPSAQNSVKNIKELLENENLKAVLNSVHIAKRIEDILK